MEEIRVSLDKECMMIGNAGSRVAHYKSDPCSRCGCCYIRYSQGFSSSIVACCRSLLHFLDEVEYYCCLMSNDSIEVRINIV